MKKDPFFQNMEALGLALSFDDVRLKSGYSGVDLADISMSSRFARQIPLKYPVVSAAMDTVTQASMAIAMAKFGGLGIIHKAQTPVEQAAQVLKVKLTLNALIEEPVCIAEDDTIEEALRMCERMEYEFRSFPVLNSEKRLVGLLTQNDFDRCRNNKVKVREEMTPLSELITAPSGTTLEKADEMLRQSRKKILPLVNDKGELSGMFSSTDVKREITGSAISYNMDDKGHLRVGAAIGTGAHEIERAVLLIEAGSDVLVIDTAHGDSKNVYETLRELKKMYPETQIVVGNISEGDSAKRLVDAGADGIKVGQGPGSICTTRIVAGIGCPQVTAIYNCAKALMGSGVPVIADGGIRYSGDITIAIGAGADCVMLGSVIAGTTETPGKVKDWGNERFKIYRGMGSLGAMQSNKAARERYRQEEAPASKLIPEGIESRVAFKGPVVDVLQKQIGGLRAGMGYVGASTIEELQKKGDFHRLSSAGLAESHPHDVIEIDNQTPVRRCS